jgi:integrase/recombinase XerD
VIKQLAARVGLEGVTSHSLRRSAITAAHSAGLPLRALAELGGHQSASNLQRYLDADVFRAEADAARSLLFGAGPQTSITGSQRA